MKISKNEYGKMADKASPPSPWLKNCCFAFLIGGLICSLGEGLFLLFGKMGADEETGRSLVSICLIVITAILTGFGVFDKIGKVAGAGTMVPITGFANSIASPAMEFHTEGLVLGTAANMFKIAGPVIVYGCSASVLYGVIVYLFKLY